ncbi:YfdQ family protein [Mameliella sp. CS4]|nr:YfdQ family protein [Mameliella sp. CS4]
MNPNPKGPDMTETAQTDPRAALDVALNAARLADPVIEGEHGKRFTFGPTDFKLTEIPNPHALPPHIQAQPVVDDAQSLITYANRFSSAESLLIADIDSLRVMACLDYHAGNQDSEPLVPGPRKHTATLQLRESEEFKRWNEVQGELIDQMAFAEFLDENASDIIDPEPTVMIEIARDLEATQGVNFKSSTRLQTGERSIVYETETHTKGEMKVPTQFTLQIPLFAGEAPVDITASFRFRPSAGGLKLGFVWRRVEYRRQAEFQQVATRIAEGTGLPVVFGRPA